MKHQCEVVETDEREEVAIKVETNTDTEMQLVDLTVTGIKQSVVDGLNPLPTCSCIVYLVNGLNPNASAIASFITSLFNDQTFQENPAPILLAVNKSDARRCIHNSILFESVEKEVGQLQQIAEYSFKKYSPCTIYSCNCSVLTDSVKTVLEFLDACCQ